MSTCSNFFVRENIVLKCTPKHEKLLCKRTLKYFTVTYSKFPVIFQFKKNSNYQLGSVFWIAHVIPYLKNLSEKVYYLKYVDLAKEVQCVHVQSRDF